MPNGFPAFPQSRFPNDMPPTLFHPASPNIETVKPTNKISDTASLASVSTFSSSISLIKEKASKTAKLPTGLKSRLPISYKDYRARKDAEAAAKGTVVTVNEQGKILTTEKQARSTSSKKSNAKPLLPDYDARARTAEAYMIYAMTR